MVHLLLLLSFPILCFCFIVDLQPSETLSLHTLRRRPAARLRLGYLLGLLGLGSELECYQAKNVLHLHRHVVACQRHVPPVHSSIEFLFCPVYPGVGGVSGNSLRKASRAGLKVVKVRRDLMAGGTTLYSAEALEAKELNLRLLTLVYLEDPSGRIHVVPYREVSRKLMFILFGARLL